MTRPCREYDTLLIGIHGQAHCNESEGCFEVTVTRASIHEDYYYDYDVDTGAANADIAIIK